MDQAEVAPFVTVGPPRNVMKIQQTSINPAQCLWFRQPAEHTRGLGMPQLLHPTFAGDVSRSEWRLFALLASNGFRHGVLATSRRQAVDLLESTQHSGPGETIKGPAVCDE